MSQRPEQTVIGARKIDIDRFNIARPGRNSVQIPHRQIREDIALKAKTSLQIFSRSVMQRDLSHEGQQNWPMKNEKEPPRIPRDQSSPAVGRAGDAGALTDRHRPQSDSIAAPAQSKGQMGLPRSGANAIASTQRGGYGDRTTPPAYTRADQQRLEL